MFGVSVWILPGYIPRVFLRKTEKQTGTLPEERILGYAVLGLLCLLSLRYCGDPIWGAACGTALAWGGAAVAWRSGLMSWPRADWSWAWLLKIAFLLTITATYLPLICGLRTEYRLPDIYDLPKHLAAVTSIAHAVRWPAPNPFAPGLPFAYNLLFYMPAGVMSKLAGWASATGMFYSISLLWVVWNMLGLVERVTASLGGKAGHRLVAILFGTVVSGYTGLLRPMDIPMSFNIKIWGLSKEYFDDPTTTFAYVPQHLFAVACFMAILCFVSSHALSPLKASMAASILLAGGMLSSAVLAPILIAAAVPLLLLVAWPEKTPFRDCLPRAAAGGAILLAIAGPFILEYASWAGPGGRPQIKLVDANFLYSGLSFGPVCILALAGFVGFSFQWRGGRAREVYGLICGFLALFWLLVLSPELQLKSAEAIRFVFIPAAAFGFVWIWHFTRSLWVVRFAIVIPVFVVPAVATLLEAESFASSAYLPRSPEERGLLAAVDRLPSDAIIGLQQPSQVLAASLGGRLTVMDFRAAREDAYVPASERQKYAETVELLQGSDAADIYVPGFADALIVPGSSSSAPLWAAICGANSRMAGGAYWLVDLGGCGKRGVRSVRSGPAITLEAMKWDKWGVSTNGSEDNPVTRTVSSPTEADFGLISPVHLLPGVYRIKANIAGSITGPSEGAAHISLHGKEKLINIQPGNYEKGKDFTGYSSLTGGFQGYISFGLGGWSHGAGWIRLNALTIERISGE
jgi:hypothetical protein